MPGLGDVAQDDRDRMRSFALATDVLGGVAIIAGTIGLVMLLTSDDGDAEPLACGPRGCAATWTF